MYNSGMSFLDAIKHQTFGPLAWLEGTTLYVTGWFSITAIPVAQITEIRRSYVHIGKYGAAYSFDARYNKKWYSLREPAFAGGHEYDSSPTTIIDKLVIERKPSVVSLSLLRKLVEINPSIQRDEYINRYLESGDYQVFNS